MKKVLKVAAIVLACFFPLTAVIYWFNLDMKLVRKVYDKLGEHYDSIERERKL